MKKRTALSAYIIGDWLALVASWTCFFIYRKQVETEGLSVAEMIADPRLHIGLVVIPLVWMLLFVFIGHYTHIFRKTGAIIFYETFSGITIGCLGLLFTVMPDDLTLGYISYVQSFGAALIIHLFFILISRLTLYHLFQQAIRRGKIVYKILLISSGRSVEEGVVKNENDDRGVHQLDFSDLNELEQWLEKLKIDEVRIDTDSREIAKIALQSMGWHEADVLVVASESTCQALDLPFTLSPMLGKNWIPLRPKGLTQFEKNLKRTFDILISSIAIVLLSPVMAICAWKVARSSAGPVFFVQERIGMKGKPFFICKFRSMRADAEQDGPVLTSEDDRRCTPWGRVMRKWRLDEIPQFFNVIRGEMSLVGPRPERAYYIEKLKNEVSHYNRILQVRPGITSWGQIKYGYASSISQMIQRLRYDMLYIDNQSLLFDLRILLFTLSVLWKGKGR